MRLRLNGELRWAAAEDAGLLRDALGAVPPSGPAGGRSSPTCPTRWSGSCAAGRACTARSRRASCASATAWTSRRCWPGSSAPASWCAASCAPAAREREWCDPEVLRRLRRASLAALRKEIEPADQRALARFMPELAGRRPPPAGRRRASTGCATCSSRCRGSRCPSTCGRRTCCRAAPAPTRRAGWTSCARRARWCGSARARSAGAPARSRCTSARTSRCSARRPAAATPPAEPAHEAIRERLRGGAVLLHRPARRRRRASPPRSSRRRCGTSCGRAR